MRLFSISLGVLIVLSAIGGFFFWGLRPGGFLAVFDSSADTAVSVIRSWGAWGVLGSIALMVMHSFLPFPAEVVALANGMVYGPFWGSVVTWVGAMIGASLAFWVVRLLGRPFIQRFVPARHQQAIERWSHDKGTVALLVSRLIPVIAFNLINYAAALTGVSWRTFLWTTGLGILPLTVLLATAGDRVMELPLWVSLVVSLGLLAVWFVVARWWRGRSKADSH
ncbi:MAG: TVP38/TMEM64 family protein [Paralcaligenes sp.]